MALGLTEDIIGYRTERSNGLYRMRFRGISRDTLCVVDAPASVSQAQLEVAIGAALGRDWSRGMSTRGPVWFKPDPADTNFRFRIRITGDPFTRQSATENQIVVILDRDDLS